VVYNTKGEKVRTLLDKSMAPGSYEILWDARDDEGNTVELGIYFILMKASNQKVHFEKAVKAMFLI